MENYTLGLVDTKGQSTGSFSPKNIAGDVIPISALASIVWSVDNSAIASITPSSDNSSCAVVPLAIGNCNVTLTVTSADGSIDTAVTLVTVTAGTTVDTLNVVFTPQA